MQTREVRYFETKDVKINIRNQCQVEFLNKILDFMRYNRL